MSVRQQIAAALNFTGQGAGMMSAPRRPTGEVLFVCALLTDTIGWITEQMDEEDTVCVVLNVSPEFIRTQSFGSAGQSDDRPWVTVGDLGLTSQTTLAEIIQQQDSGRIGSNNLVAV
jgi:hypothetical protein